MSNDQAGRDLDAPVVSTHSPRPRVIEVAVRGDLDMQTSEHVQKALDTCFDDEGVEILSLHLGGVSFIDSTGLRVLIRARRAAQAVKRVLVLTSPSEAVLRLLEVTGLNALFDIADG